MKKIVQLLLLVLFATTVSASNDITIDGVLDDWEDENGFYLDDYGDTNPARTDITQYGISVVDNGTLDESLALVLVTDTFQNGNPNGDSHKLVFYSGVYEIVVTIQNGCDDINEVMIEGNETNDFNAAVGIIDPPVYNDSTPDCALEIEFPITTLPDLDSDNDGELLDEVFVTRYATRQSGGQGNDNDFDIDDGLLPSAIQLTSIESNSNSGLSAIILVLILLILTTLVIKRNWY